MGRMSLMPAVILAALASPVVAEDFPNALVERDATTRLDPTSAWNLEYGESRCRLARWFGDESEPHLLVFEQSAPRRRFDLTIAGPLLTRFQRVDAFHIGMERDEAMDEVDRFGRSELEGVGRAIVIGGHNIGPDLERGTLRGAGIDIDEAGSIDRVVISERRVTLSFETGNMRAPFEALNTCTSEMLRRWGLDPAQHQSYVPPRLLDSGEVRRRIEARYPDKALARREEALVAFTVIVEADGSVSGCMADNATPTETLQSPACEEIATARFEPARNADGEPMRSYITTNITYVAH